MQYVTDSHPLVWHMTENPALSSEAKRIFQRADNFEDTIFIPCIIFFELVYLIEKKKIPIDFDNFIEMINSKENYKIEPLCLPIIEQSRTISRELSDPWDRLIAANSLHLNLPLITRDERMGEVGIRVIW